MTKKQHYMTPTERAKLEVYYNEDRLPVAEIARRLGFCRQTIYNELRIGMYWHTIGGYKDVRRYSADKAQQIHDYMATGKGRPEKIGSDHEYAAFLERKILTDKFSPAAALAAARKAGYATRICTSTLYSYINKGLFLHLRNRDLWEKSKRKTRKGQPEPRIAHAQLPSITERPTKIRERAEPGHWEMDLIVGKAGTLPVLLTLTERQRRQELIFKLPDRKATTVRGIFDELEKIMPDFREQFKSITTDNGSEFMQYEQLRQSIHGGTRFDVYYCHSYAAWEKGSNENHNRMIRRFFPKGTDFTEISEARIADVQDWMNNYPRKILNWKTPNELAV